jgi:hypothetical protein
MGISYSCGAPAGHIYNYFEDNTSALGSTGWLTIEYVCKGFVIHHNVLNASRSYDAICVLGDGFQVAVQRYT